MRNLEQIKIFLLDKLNEFIEHFPNTKVSYIIDDFDSVFVEVLPNSIYRSDKEYINWENQITDEFLEAFPYFNLAFISEDAYVTFDKWDFELIGNVFDAPTHSLSFENFVQHDVLNTYNNVFCSNTFFTVDDTFQSFNQLINNSIKDLAYSKPSFKGDIYEATELVKKSNEFILAA